MRSDRSPLPARENIKTLSASFKRTPFTAKTYSPSLRCSSQTVQLASKSEIPPGTLTNHSAQNPLVFDIPSATESSQIRPRVDDLDLVPARATDSVPTLANTNTPVSLPPTNSAVAPFEIDPTRAPSCMDKEVKDLIFSDFHYFSLCIVVSSTWVNHQLRVYKFSFFSLELHDRPL